jgi:hypothetical protein
MIGPRGGGRGGWKWSIRMSEYTSASGTEETRLDAIQAAVQAIDRALGPKISDEV